MKAVKKILCPVLVIWYLLAVSGIDVHTDCEHGHIYIAPTFLGLDCEQLHPHDHCHDNGCDNGHVHCITPGCEDDEDCCHDDFLYILAQGTASHNDFFAAIVPEMIVPWILQLESTTRDINTFFSSPAPKQERDIPTVFCVSRS